MTTRLYYADSYLRRFTGTVLEVHPDPAKERPAVVLDRSAFYPTSGGQPHDRGTLGTAHVVDVAVRESDGAVLHVLDQPIGTGPATGEIDWPRRLDHMQQHSGQHILSQAFLEVAGAETIGFHLTPDTVSIDLAVRDLADAQIAGAESVANAVVAADTPVRAWFPEPEELAALRLRKAPEVEGAIRVVAIGDFDMSACGGTHVAATGEIGLVAVLRAERLKRGTRVEFMCGDRARADYGRKHALVRELSTSLTCSPAELGESVHRLREALQETRRQLAVFQERELDQEASSLLAGATPHGTVRIVRAAWADRPIEQVKGLSLRLTANPGVVVLFGIAGAKAQVLFGRSEDLASLDLGPPFRAALDRMGGGRGGGTRMLQGAAGASDLTRLRGVLAQAEKDLAGAG